MTINVGEVAMVSLESIEVGDRARQDMGDLNDMEASMKASGLISPLAVKRIDDTHYILLAGERRYMILQKNEVSTIPVRVYPNDITPEEMKSIELAENFYRKDFEYWEHDNLVREIHELQQSIHGAKAPGPGQQGWGVNDTGTMMGASKAAISTAIKRSEAREAFPELFDKCKTQQDASKLINKINEAAIKDAIAKKLELNTTDSSIAQIAKCFIVRDFFDAVKEIPSGIMHLVEIDPPYAINMGGKGSGSDAKKSDGESMYVSEDYNEIPAEHYMDGDPNGKWLGMNRLFKECYRAAAEHSWLICWFAPEPWFEEIFQAIKNAGFNSTRMCGIWTKPSGQSKRPEMHLASSYESFFYAWKGRPAINKAGRSNNFPYSPVPPQKKTHPTERPVELMEDIYETFAFPGSRILIPFLGSGNGLIAGNNKGMAPVGFELSKAYRDSFLVKLHGMKGV